MATAPMSAVMKGLNSPVESSVTGTSCNCHPRFRAGFSRARYAENESALDWACPSDMPGRSRPMTPRSSGRSRGVWRPRRCRGVAENRWRASHLEARPASRRPRSMLTTPLTPPPYPCQTRWPTMPGSAPNRLYQYPAGSTTSPGSPNDAAGCGPDSDGLDEICENDKCHRCRLRIRIGIGEGRTARHRPDASAARDAQQPGSRRYRRCRATRRS